MQSYCLFIVIKHKKTNYQLRFNECVEAAVRQEFLHRNEGIKTTNSKFETTFISQKKLEKQEYMKDKNSFDFNVFSDRLNRILDSLSMTTDYKLVYKDSNYKNEIGLRRKSDYSKASFFVVKYFTAKKDIKIQAKVYYPLSVYSGDFLSIVTLSFMVIGFIIIILITQLRILAKQILLSQTKENLTVFFTHELSSPLQCALTGVEMLESSLKDNDLIEHEKYLKISKEKLLYINCFIDTPSGAVFRHFRPFWRRRRERVSNQTRDGKNVILHDCHRYYRFCRIGSFKPFDLTRSSKRKTRNKNSV